MGRITLLTSAACVSLMAILAIELRPANVEPAIQRRPGSLTATRETSLSKVPPVDAWTNLILARPLFSRDRRPTEAAHAGKAALPRLTGTIRGSEGELAIFQSADGKSHVLGPGAMIAEWTLAGIIDGAVTLEHGANIITLRLSYANLPIVPQPAATPAVIVLHDKRSNPFLQP